jgi:GNAT superfamily N-acetyltransferase
MPIRYSTDANDLATAELDGFFVGWPNKPSNATLIASIAKSDHCVLAFDDQRLIGFITAITDHTLCAFIPLLEVLPEYQKQGIGRELVQQMNSLLANLYAIDLICDEDLVPFYTNLGFTKTRSMSIRNYERI